jgi:hypothetical protein
VHPVCSNCIKYDLECEYPPEKPTSSRGSSPKTAPLKRIASSDTNPTSSSPYSSPSPPKCKCQMLEDAGLLPRRGSGVMGMGSFGDQDAQNAMDAQFLQPGALQSNTINTPTDRLLELKLMHRKYLWPLNNVSQVSADTVPIPRSQGKLRRLSCLVVPKKLESVRTLTHPPSRLYESQFVESL